MYVSAADTASVNIHARNMAEVNSCSLLNYACPGLTAGLDVAVRLLPE